MCIYGSSLLTTNGTSKNLHECFNVIISFYILEISNKDAS